ncbi:MAG: aspartate kinase [Candidatus Cloacimonetes bacterium]|nr:aspartate kinase [Candidatus Cloacimonadota bacterium]MDD4155732.1 aspartate kinase [Candidatus Cloacimonadota bacterium]
MNIIVKKFGGTSVGSIDKIKKIADNIAKEKMFNDKDIQFVVVVSAMEKTTDNLFELAHQISAHPNQRELDMLVTAGERITIALLSLALQEKGIQSISFTGSQSGIITDNSHGNAKILTVNAFRIPTELNKNKLVIVAGFQGVSLEKEITTLGRGGSDTTAISLACYLQASKCEIYTDVKGVYSADPRVVENVCFVKNISYEEMLFLTLNGSKVLHSRAAEFAQKYNIPIEIKSSFENCEGTMISQHMEESYVKAIAHKEKLVKIAINAKKDNQFVDLPDFKTEIFDMEYLDTQVYFLIDKQYQEQFIDEITENNLEYYIDKECLAVITLTGYRICKDIKFFNNLKKILDETCNNDFIIKNQGIGVSVLFNSENFNLVIKVLHKKFLVSEFI